MEWFDIKTAFFVFGVYTLLLTAAFFAWVHWAGRP